MNRYPDPMLTIPFDMPRQWQGARVSSQQGVLADLVQAVPHFDRKPFIIGDLVNPHADLIIRIPRQAGETPAPVAMVSKSYVLIDHHTAIGALVDALKQDLDQPEKLTGQMLLTEFGERLYLQLWLPNWTFTLSNNESLDLVVHLLNSVDRSLSLQVRLGWYRRICTNGAFIGVEAAGFRQTHTPPLNRIDISGLLYEQLATFKAEQARLEEWLTTAVIDSTLAPWIDQKVARRWGIITAARIYSILRTGYDGTVLLGGEKRPPHAYPVRQSERVPGILVPAATLFDVSQVLSWIAVRTTAVQDQLTRMAEVYPLMAQLVDLTAIR